FPRDPAALAAALERAALHMREKRLPYAFVLQKGAVEAAATGRHRTSERVLGGAVRGAFGEPLDPDLALRALVAGVTGTDVVIATTGYTGRALYAVGDRPSQLYMVG